MSAAASPLRDPTGTSRDAPFLEIEDLSIRFPTEDGVVRAVDGLSFSVRRGKTLGIVGESGSGKSVTCLALMGLHDRARTRITGSIRIDGEDVVSMDEDQVRRLRGRRMAMIFQDPLTALHPYYTIGRQIAEAYRVHNDVSAGAARARAIELVDRVGIPHPDKRVDSYPHELSGGMRQRAMIAMALSCDPELLIADEPTTALDVTVQAQILDLMADLQRELGTTVILITHDLGVVAHVADDVLVMYAGRAMETGSEEQVLRRPRHPYTWGLLRSVPSLRDDPDAELVPIVGNPPSLIDVPSGCPFHPRCPYADLNGDKSYTVVPPLAPVEGDPGHRVACHLPADVGRRLFEEQLAGVEPTTDGSGAPGGGAEAAP